jgi:acetyl-CoA acyltransferase
VPEVFICDAVRTPIGRYGGALAEVRADDLGAIPIRALIERNSWLDPETIEDLAWGCANQAGEDNRNVGRMSALLAGLPVGVPAVTVNRLCGSGMNAIGAIADAIMGYRLDIAIAGGVESMSRAPFVLPKQTSAFGREAALYDTTLGWRFVNPLFESRYGVDSMAETAENVAEAYSIPRADQDTFALASQQRAAAAISDGRFAEEIVPVSIPQKRGDDRVVDCDEHPRPETTLEALEKLKPIVRPGGTVTAGNASGINDGACALLLASDDVVTAKKLKPLARVLTWAVAGVEPRMMGMGPVPAAQKALKLAGLKIGKMDLIELNEAFAAQAIACLVQLGIDPGAAHVNPNGGAIAFGHPLGMSGARLVTTAARELKRTKGRYALCAMCIGVGQGIAMIIERA